MDTTKIETLGGSVNVTVHKNYLRNDDTSYARVQRTTASMSHVIATALKDSSYFREEDLVAAQMLFKRTVLSLLEQGTAVNLLELGVLYPTARGSIRSENPSVTDIPTLALGFIPAAEALAAVQKADIATAQVAECTPVINLVEDLSTHKSDCTLTANMPARIAGRRLRIAGAQEETGLFFAPQQANGTIDEDGVDWIRIADSRFFKNTASSFAQSAESLKSFIKTYSTVILLPVLSI